MRILVVTNLFPPDIRGGYEVRCAGVVEYLRRRHDVVVLTTAHGRCKRCVEPHVLRELPFLETDARGVVLRAPAASLRAAHTVKRVLGEFAPDFVYVWNGWNIPHSALFVLQQARLPLAFSVGEQWFARIYSGDKFMRHLTPGRRGLRLVWGGLMRGVNLHPDLRLRLDVVGEAAVAWNSNALRRSVGIPPGIAPVLERVIYPAPTRYDYFSNLERKPGDGASIAFVGRIERAKGPEIAVRALAGLRTRHGLRARLVLAGREDPGMRRDIDRLAEDLGVKGQVDLPGFLGTEALGRLLSEADAIVIPSTWLEPFGIVSLEAALARVPIVAARSGGLTEAIREGEHALFFPARDADACADALAATLRDGDATAARVTRAFAHARTFSFERHAEAHERFIRDALSAFGRPSEGRQGITS
ncbi:MAG: glycosyltransferase family 4 protein [Gaiellaceae bacterium]